MNPGLYVTFFNEGEAFDIELPPVGPLEHVVIREEALLADRKDGHAADPFEGGGRAIEAEYEFQRAIGNEPGGPRRTNFRIVAPQGVYLRFVSFGSTADHDPVPELGPYAVVVVGKNAVEADGDHLASRIGTKQNLWELSAAGGTALLGVIRPDIAFRTRSTVYHPQVKPFRPDRVVAAPLPAVASHPPAAPAPSPIKAVRAPEAPPPPRQAQPLKERPTKTYPPAQIAAEQAVTTLRDRIRAEQPASGPRVASAAATGRDWGSAAWRLRFAIIAALVVLMVAFSVPSVRSIFTIGAPGATISTVGVGVAVTSPDWSYSVGSVRRIAKIGAAQARGIFLVVQVAVTNRKGPGAQLLPSGFELATADGEQVRASGATSGVYSGDANLTSSYAWPTEFPVGRSVVVPIIFDVSPSVTGTELVISDVPTTRIRLE